MSIDSKIKNSIECLECGRSMDDLISIKCAAYMLGIGPATAYRRVNAGKLEVVDADGVLKVQISDIERMRRRGPRSDQRRCPVGG